MRLFLSGILAVIAVAVFLFIDYKRFLSTPMVVSDSPKTFTVQSGDTISVLVRSFDKNGFPLASKSPFAKTLGSYYFRYLAKSSRKANQLKIGEYQLYQGMTPPQVLDTLVSGKTIVYSVRFLEGWNFKQLRTELQNNPHIDHTLLFVPDSDIMATLQLGDGQTAYEGQFFPDTYQFTKHTKDSKILRRAYALMQKNLHKAWQARDKSIKLKSPYELLILASIIEKETSLDSERQQISGVFHRRLAKGMPLQTDPSVIYGMGDQYNGTIYRSDLKRNTPYNTYINKGLPPTPIASPGLASLLAAGQPDKGQSLYFVANGRGGHTFSNTYQQHLQAVKIYRQQLKHATTGSSQ
ncbi:MAG: aminodeoxychorismate lyase [Gammaproteobacteria bacterium]|nr:MAG: aminodeoxychorismate lyase [Gammaproteobacteria bacterium]